MSGAGGLTVWLIMASLIGLGAGGIIGKIVCSLFKGGVHYVYSCCGGMLAGLLCFEMIPHALHYYHSTGVFIGIVNGYAWMLMLDFYLHKRTHAARDSFLPFFLFVAIALHTIPAGLNIGAAVGNESFPLSAFLTALILHQVPEGVALMMALSTAKVKEWLFLFIALLLAGTLGGSVLAGNEMNIESVKLHTLLAGTAIGTFFYITINEIVWKSFRKMNVFHFVGSLFVGLVVMKLYLHFF